jgi:hypothetical protein
MATEVLPAMVLNLSLHPDLLLDIEVGFRDTFNYMLDADEVDRSVRDAARGILLAFLEHLKRMPPRDALVEFAISTNELIDSATCRQSQIRAASARCLMGLWAARTRVFTLAFQQLFFTLKSFGSPFPRPDIFEYSCFRTMLAHARYLEYSFLWPILYGDAPKKLQEVPI